MVIHPMNVTFDWKKDDINKLDFVDCRYMRIWHHRSDTFDFENLPKAPELRELEIYYTNVKSIRGLGKYPYLNKIDLYYLRNLTTLDGIEEINPQIKVFSIKSAKKLTDAYRVSQLEHLEGLGLDDCADIENIDFISDLYDLKGITFTGTNVVNGDLSPVADHFNLRRAGFNNKRHYSHSYEDIRAIHLFRIHTDYQ